MNIEQAIRENMIYNSYSIQVIIIVITLFLIHNQLQCNKYTVYEECQLPITIGVSFGSGIISVNH